MSAVTGIWAFILLDRTPDWLPALRWAVLAGSIIVAAVLVAGAHRLGRATAVLAIGAVVAGAGATAAYTAETVANTHSGPMTMSGPSKEGGAPMDGPGGRGPGGVDSDNAALAALVKRADNRWAAATVGSFTAGSLELKTGASVMAIGGFTGSDNSPTLAQFQAYVADGQVRYFIPGDRGGPPGGESGSASEITTWVQQNFAPIDVGGTTVYNLQTR
jgi:4-amino-4-deoxy-L-arabinose transferase-like glycosyltransferase